MNSNSDNKSKMIPLIKLTIWIVVFIALLLIANFQDRNKNIVKEDNTIKTEAREKTFEEMLSQLNNNYRYTYIIKLIDKEYTFSGEKMLDSNGSIIEHFTKRINNDSYEYFIKYEYIYEVKNNELEKTDIKKVYENININYLDINKIKELITNYSYIVKDNEYLYELGSIQVNFVTDKDLIIKITIIDSENEYNLNLEDINKINNVTY